LGEEIISQEKDRLTVNQNKIIYGLMPSKFVKFRSNNRNKELMVSLWLFFSGRVLSQPRSPCAASVWLWHTLRPCLRTILYAR